MVKKNDNLNETDKENKTNKEKILSSLLEGPKTNTQLLIELGYKNNQHKYISKDLGRLKDDGFIVSDKIKSENLDDDCTQWSLVLKFDVLSLMLKKYSGLLSLMQKKDHVLEVITENMRIPITYSVHLCHKGEEKFISGKEELHPLKEEDRKIFKEMLRLSPEFFKYNLLYDYSILKSDFDKLAQTLKTIDEIHGLQPRWLGWGHYYHYFMAFKICVLMDLLYGKSVEGEKEYLIELEKEKVKEHSDKYPK